MCALCSAGITAPGQCPAADGSTNQEGSGSAGSPGQATTAAQAAPYSYQQIADYLTVGYWGTEDHKFISNTITYNIEGLTAAGQQLALAALQAWQDVCAVTFVRTTNTAMLTFDDTYGGAYTGWTFGGSDGTDIITSYINIGTYWLSAYGTGTDTYSYQTYVHEIGHALGLGHAGPYNGGGSYNANALYANDTWQYSIMSYWGQTNYDNGSTRYVMTPEIADILAVQNQYGATTGTRTGNSVYGFNATAGSVFNFANYASAPALTVYDNGGQDTLDCSGYSDNQVIDLRPGSYSSIGGLSHNIGIALNTVIESATGGAGNDVITGSGSNGAVLRGLAGNDTIMSYAGNLQLGLGDDGSDQLFFIGNQNQLVGGDGTDWLGASGDANALFGTAGNDWMGASGSFNTVVGGEGHDALFAFGANNGLYGEGGNDWLGVSGANNTLAGGAGFDWIGATGSGNSLAGGDDADTVFAFGVDNTLRGGDGNDWVGISGNGSRLFGDDGNDFLAASGNGNILDGGLGNDRLVTGGHSGDTFVYHPDYQQDQITGFAAHADGGSDVIDLVGYGLTFDNLINLYTTQNGNDTVIDFSGGNTLTLHAVQKNHLAADDFLLT